MTLIQRFNGETIDLDAYGIRTKDFIVSAPVPEHSTESVMGMHGVTDMGTQFAPREIICTFRFISKDFVDFGMIRDEVFAMLRADRAFYLIEKRNLGKRWLVKTANTFTIPQKYVYGDFEVSFTSYTGFAESVGRTTDPQTFDADVWQIGQGLLFEDYAYSFNTDSFEVYNAGNETVNPKNPNMDILISVKADAPEYFELVNTTTGETYRYNGSLRKTDTLRLEGIRSTRNSLSVFRDTNHKIITLAPGINEFEVNGTNSIDSIEFDFRFYYV